MYRAFVIALVVSGLSSCAKPEVQAPTANSLSPAAAVDECYCSVRKRHQVKVRLDKKKQPDLE